LKNSDQAEKMSVQGQKEFVKVLFSGNFAPSIAWESTQITTNTRYGIFPIMGILIIKAYNKIWIKSYTFVIKL
jgi:hypothetical protein